MPKDAPVNTGAPLEEPIGPHQRVSEMQAKLHRWAAADGGRRFDDLFNLVHDPATLRGRFVRCRCASARSLSPAGRGRSDDLAFP